MYVLAGTSLQKWKLNNNDPEQLVFANDLNRIVQEAFQSHETQMDRVGNYINDSSTWLLDIQPDHDGIIILAGTVNLQISPQVRYGLVKIEMTGNNVPMKHSEFASVKLNGFYREENPTESLSYRFLNCNGVSYIYNQKTITVVTRNEEPDTLEFASPHDFILGGSVCVNTPIFFSRNHGLVAVLQNDTDLDLSNLNNTMSNFETTMADNVNFNLTLYNLDAEEIGNAHKDAVGQLTAAFLFYTKSRVNNCKEILNELFPRMQSVLEVDSFLDKTVVDLCKELLDDIPASDPRWSGQGDVGLGSSHSMQIYK